MRGDGAVCGFYVEKIGDLVAVAFVSESSSTIFHL